jgi:hypothetical protein
MSLGDHDARFAVGLDLLFVDAARQHVALIRRQQEQQLAMLGEKLHWGEPAATGILRALFGLDHPARDPRFLGRLLWGFMLPEAWPWPRLLRQAGFLEGRLRPTLIEWSMGTQRHSPVFKDVLSGLERVLPFLGGHR